MKAKEKGSALTNYANELKKACCSDNIRRDKVAALLSTVNYDSKETLEAAINSFTNCNLSDDELFKLVYTITPDYVTKAKEAQDKQTRRSGVF